MRVANEMWQGGERVKLNASEIVIGDNTSPVLLSNVLGKPSEYISVSPENEWEVLSRCEFMKDALGFVHVNGRLQNGIIDHETVLFTLPQGYRPLWTQYMNAICYTNQSDVEPFMIIIRTNGETSILFGAKKYVVLNFSFKAE